MDAVADRTVFITAHGISGIMKSRLAAKASTLIDATCPLVSRVHTVGQELEGKGYQVVLVGEHDHPESMGTLGDLDHGIIIETAEDAEALPHFSRLGVIAQTTIDQDHFWNVVEVLKAKGDEVVVENTICVPTRERQDSARKLAKEVDAMVVVGGRNSSNTKRLKELAERYCPALQVTSADELDPAWFIHHKKIGVTAGASTPDSSIQAVVEKIRKF
jgi:4-hydroxy-3-methylbut-2-enyl diphosphate reductase